LEVILERRKRKTKYSTRSEERSRFVAKERAEKKIRGERKGRGEKGEGKYEKVKQG